MSICSLVCSCCNIVYFIECSIFCPAVVDAKVLRSEGRTVATAGFRIYLYKKVDVSVDVALDGSA